MKEWQRWSSIFAIVISVILFLIGVIRGNTSDSIKQLNTDVKNCPTRIEVESKVLPLKTEIDNLKLNKADKSALESLKEESKERDDNSKQRDIRIESKLDKLIYMHLHANIDSIKLQYIIPVNIIECYSMKSNNHLVCKK
jgi:hypothetical protein